MRLELLNKLEEIANEKHDGHYSIFKFTTNWRVCLGTSLDPLREFDYMAEGKTLEEAIQKAIDENISEVSIWKYRKENEVIVNRSFGECMMLKSQAEELGFKYRMALE